MTTQRLGVIMNGVTGRMGLNQHLIRSIIAIRDSGGVLLSNGDLMMPDPILVGRNEDRLQALPKEEREIAQRTREVDATSRAFELLTRWEGEARIALSSASSPVAAIDTPALPTVRSSPNLSRQPIFGPSATP